MGIQQALMSGGQKLTLTAQTVVFRTPSGTPTAGFRIDSDGGIYIQATGGGGAFVKTYDWIAPNYLAANYECRWTASGTAPDVTPAAVNTWVACTSDRTWQTTSAANLDEPRSFVCEIGLAGTSTALVSVTITVDADGTP